MKSTNFLIPSLAVFTLVISPTFSFIPPIISTLSGESAAIVAQHNQYRSEVKPGPAINMKTMSWHDGLATAAQAWADSCEYKHGNPDWIEQVIGPDGQAIGKSEVGQNLFMGTTGGYDWKFAIGDWNNEKRFYDYCTKTCTAPPDEACGHYTQIVWADNTHVGCGQKDCTNGPNSGQTLKVCNYFPGGNIRGRRPYKLDKQNQACGWTDFYKTNKGKSTNLLDILLKIVYSQ